MNQCATCHFYDRRGARASDGNGLARGLCRRSAPHLNPQNARTHSIEGVWPVVRDDDWCGQWTQLRRIAPAPQAGPATFVASKPAVRAPAPTPAAGSAAAIAAGYKPLGVKS